LANILIAVTPAPGHVNPLLTIARHLQSSGHDVCFNTAEVFRTAVERTGIEFIPFEGKCSLDFRRMDEIFPERRNAAPGPEQLNFDMKYIFADAIPDQHRGLQRILRERDIDLILTDLLFCGTLPMLLTNVKEERPPVVSFGICPMFLSGVDAPSSSSPDATDSEQERLGLQAMLDPADDHFNAVLEACGAPALPGFFFDCLYTLPDLFLQLTAEEFEFPRSAMPDSIRFVGPMPLPASDFNPPAWWKELDGSRPVVLVTQGTIANSDLSELIEPALLGLGGENVTVIAATGRNDGLSIAVPGNAKVEQFIPFDKLLPKVQVLVTNGGYGAVNSALAEGVPVVVAGETEDKPLVAARVEWSGTGVNLGTSRPTANQVRNAVQTVLSSRAIDENVRRVQEGFARHDTLCEIDGLLNSLVHDHNEARLEYCSVAG
jgi:MGT family glycosyltransferase